jgi:DNA-binding IclR family transcriptional regulator
MAHTYEDLKKKTLADLRDLAKDLQHEAVQGYTQMNKDHLLPAICKALGIDAREHHAAHGALKIATRARMKALRAKRQEAVSAGDSAALKAIRREYHHLNHRLRIDARKPDNLAS